ncbi:MAG TPA: prepilin-type N-terminal cleavage/methylation domain-containing protein [Chthoniobacteraceae bacterium]|nr:prepilin-type N-terminal cleavage/methylation domain-containing protein [Chthoniobacteraceae bacterium]
MSRSPVPSFSLKSAEKRSAFSLTELLVGIAVISALAVLALVAVQSARVATDRARCVHQLRQAGIAVMAYTANRNQVLQTFAGGVPELEIWGNQLLRERLITKEGKGLLRCPSSPAGYDVDNVNWYWSAYGINVSNTTYGSLITGRKPGESIYRLPLPAVPEPSRFVLLADSGGAGRNAAGVRTQTFRLHNLPRYESGVIARHRGHANVYFLDGHVESVPEARFADLDVPYHDTTDRFRPRVP